MKPHPKYKPIGTVWSRIEWVGDKWVSGTRGDNPDCARHIAEMTALIPAAEKQYDTKVRVGSSNVSHGHSNRDGDYTERWVMHYFLEAEVYAYSNKDVVSMAHERLLKAFKSDNKENK